MPLTPTTLANKKVETSPPRDSNFQPWSVLCIPVVNPTTGEVTGYIPLSVTIDADGKAMLNVKVIP